MATYIYQTVPKDGEEPKQFEIVQSMKDAPLTHHPETGEPVRRVIVGGYGFNAKGMKIDPFSNTQFLERTSQKGGTLGELFDRSAELSEMRAAKTGGVEDPFRRKIYDNYSKKYKGTKHEGEMKAEHKKAKEEVDKTLRKVGREMGLD